MKHIFLGFAAIIFSTTASVAQSITPKGLDELSHRHSLRSFNELHELLSIPNDANHPDDIYKNVKWIEKAFAERKFKTLRLETETVPLVLAERRFDDAENTVLVYLQVDGQPVDTSKWDSPPFEPTLKQEVSGKWESLDWSKIEKYDDEWRVFARSASDAKGPVMMFLAAIDAMEELGAMPNYNIKVILDFEEELGSPRLPKAVIDYKDELQSDMLVIFDGPMHISNKPTLVFGARGIATMTITTYGPIKPQHSGHYGNYAPNPALRLAKLLASMKDDKGMVTIPGYYDGIKLSEEIHETLKSVPDDENEIKTRLQIANTDDVGSYYQESLQYPSLNIRGMQSGWIDKEVRTIIPAWARAELDIRLVPESDPERLIDLIHKHIEKLGYLILDNVPNKIQRLNHPNIVTINSEISYQAFRTDFDSEIGQWLEKSLTHAYGEKPVMERIAGGSIPISPFVVTLGIPAVSVPTVNRDNNQHSPNENIRLGNYRNGIKTILSVLTTEVE